MDPLPINCWSSTLIVLLGHLRQLGIGGLLRDLVRVIRASSEPASSGLILRQKFLALKEGLVVVPFLGVNNLCVEGGLGNCSFMGVQCRRGSWRFDIWIIDFFGILGCFFSWDLKSANYEDNKFANIGATLTEPAPPSLSLSLHFSPLFSLPLPLPVHAILHILWE